MVDEKMSVEDLTSHVGEEIGVSSWTTLDQARIREFAHCTGDHQWIHVDVERAKKEMPGGKTIAHGFLTLSLLPMLGDSVYRIRKTSRGINYGSNRVRFTNPVQVGSRVRLHQKLKAVEPVEGGQRLILESTVEIEGQSRPALVAEAIFLAFD